MNNFIKSVIEEKFASKAQQRYFYSQAGKGSKKWKQRAKEFSDKTDFEKIPEKIESNENKNRISAKSQFLKDLQNDKDYLDFQKNAIYYDDFGYKETFGTPNATYNDHYVNKRKYSRVKNSDDIEKEIEEVVDEKGIISTKKIPKSAKSKGITQRNMTDKIVKSAYASMGTHGVHGTHTSLRYWAESKNNLKKLIENTIDEIEMGDALGYEETLGKDATYDQAYSYFKKELKLSDDETKERMEKLGYDEDLKKGKIRLIENPKKYIEEFIESILTKRNSDYELVNSPNKELKEINPIIKRQIKSFREALESNDLTIEDVLEYLKNNE